MFKRGDRVCARREIFKNDTKGILINVFHELHSDLEFHQMNVGDIRKDPKGNLLGLGIGFFYIRQSAVVKSSECSICIQAIKES